MRYFKLIASFILISFVPSIVAHGLVIAVQGANDVVGTGFGINSDLNLAGNASKRNALRVTFLNRLDPLICPTNSSRCRKRA